MEKNPSNSHPEINDQPNDDSTGAGRSYECTFCKRGFTNAQALGGHMNIHRKDKAKAKAKNHQDESSTANYLRYFTSHKQQNEYYRGQVNYQVYLPSPNPNVWKQHVSHQGHVDSNLSLKIGISSQDVAKDINEVDLELRLGHDP